MTATLPPRLPAGESPPSVGAPPSPPATPKDAACSARALVANLLGLALVVFLADAIVSLADDSLNLLFGIHVLAVLRALLFFPALFLTLGVYGLLGLTPLIPKRFFLPLALFFPMVIVVLIPCAIYFHQRLPRLMWGVSLCQAVLGLLLLHRLHGGWRLQWPLVGISRLGTRAFSWRHLIVFLLVNLFGLAPALVLYAGFCLALALEHLSEGFVLLRPAGLTVNVRTYVREDGKSIQLFPMSHVGDAGFYQALTSTFPTNAIILLEGVTDRLNLITNKITYERMASALGVAEQHEEFRPRGQLISADVDVAEFSSNTIAGLNLVMLIHSRGINADTWLKLMQFAPPHFEEDLINDLLRKRNRRLLQEIHTRLRQAEHLIVPWGAAHMPEIAREIQKAGFRVSETRDLVVIRFGSAKNEPRRADGNVDSKGLP